MSVPSVSPDPDAKATRRQGVIAGAALAFGLLLSAVYLANGRSALSGDVLPATYLPIAMIRGQGVYLDRFGGLLYGSYAITGSHGHLVSRYPIAPSLLVLPVTAVQVAVLDEMRPGWEQRHVHFYSVFVARISQTVTTALTGAWLLVFCLQLGASWPIALVSAVAGGIGSPLWSVASQAAWEHGAAALGLIAALSLVWGPRLSWVRLVLAGFAAATMVAARSLDILFASSIALWVVRTHGRRALPFFAFAALIGGALLAYNYYFFGSLEGGQQQLEALHRQFHGVEGTWTGDFVGGAMGTLFSPSRGLFVYLPWALCALALLPFVGWSALPSLLRWMLPPLLFFAVALSKYSCWWAGWSFGPRFWTDVVPLLAALLCCGLQCACRAHRWLWAPVILTIAVSIGIHAIGAFAYPSSWNGAPANVDLAHDRLWDWRDNELTRSIREGIHPPDLWHWPPITNQP